MFAWADIHQEAAGFLNSAISTSPYERLPSEDLYRHALVHWVKVKGKAHRLNLEAGYNDCDKSHRWPKADLRIVWETVPEPTDTWIEIKCRQHGGYFYQAKTGESLKSYAHDLAKLTRQYRRNQQAHCYWILFTLTRQGALANHSSFPQEIRKYLAKDIPALLYDPTVDFVVEYDAPTNIGVSEWRPTYEKKMCELHMLVLKPQIRPSGSIVAPHGEQVP